MGKGIILYVIYLYRFDEREGGNNKRNNNSSGGGGGVGSRGRLL